GEVPRPPRNPGASSRPGGRCAQRRHDERRYGMSRDDDFNRTLQAWLRREAPPQAPDRVLESAMQRVSTEPQRRGWRQVLIGETPMATFLRAAALAAVIAIAVIGGLQ